MADEIKFPDPDKWYVRLLRFANMLDDGHNMLSPTKLNLWGALFATCSAAAGTAWAWFTGHITGIEHLWAPVATWMTHAMTAHHFDKRERNRTACEMERWKANGGQK